MAEIRTVTTLVHKRDEIASSITKYERKLAQARADLAHINACITIFEASGDTDTMASYVDVHRLFKRGEPIAICKVALVNGPMNTKELALHVMTAKGLDVGDKVLAKSVSLTLVHALRMQCQRGNLKDGGKMKGVRIWVLPGHDEPMLQVI
jgi:uncharacterized Zn ribbon protein